MSRRPKPSGGKKKAGPRSSPTNRMRPERRRKILVVTEGELTEPQYLERLHQYIKDRDFNLDIRPRPRKKGTGQWTSNPEAVVKKCVELKAEQERTATNSHGDEVPYEQCFAVVDVDRWDEATPGGRSKLERALRAAKEHGIKVVVSNLKFETWLVWHAEDKSYRTSKQLDDACRRLKLLSGKNITASFPIENFTVASNRALGAHATRLSAVGPNPSTSLPAFLRILNIVK